jgi:hypothetical protein
MPLCLTSASLSTRWKLSPSPTSAHRARLNLTLSFTPDRKRFASRSQLTGSDWRVEMELMVSSTVTLARIASSAALRPNARPSRHLPRKLCERGSKRSSRHTTLHRRSHECSAPPAHIKIVVWRPPVLTEKPSPPPAGMGLRAFRWPSMRQSIA